MWGETVDPSDLDATVWPRAAAVSERLWTSLDAIGIDLAVVESRLETFRCLLTQRGIGAAPVTNTQARYAPRDPGSCYVQRRLLAEN
jgi:hexosaminidase